LYQDGIVTSSSPGTNTPQVSDYLKNNPLAKFDPKSIDSYYAHLKESINTAYPTRWAELESEGDPVNLATGEFDYSNTLMQIP
jgi:hypothetical protein